MLVEFAVLVFFSVYLIRARFIVLLFCVFDLACVAALFWLVFVCLRLAVCLFDLTAGSVFCSGVQFKLVLCVLVFVVWCALCVLCVLCGVCRVRWVLRVVRESCVVCFVCFVWCVV